MPRRSARYAPQGPPDESGRRSAREARARAAAEGTGDEKGREGAGIRPVTTLRRDGRAKTQVSRQQRRAYIRAARRRSRRARFALDGSILSRARWLRGPLQRPKPRAGRHVLTDDWLQAPQDEAPDEAIEPRRLPAWLIPAFVTLLLLASAFVILPRVLAGVGPAEPSEASELAPRADVYADDAYAVVLRPVINVYARPDIRAERLTQLLYNMPVRLADPALSATGFTSIVLDDGSTGFVLDRDLTMDQRSIEPAGYDARVVVSDLTKRVMTHASAGNLIVEVKMNTTLFVVYQSSTLYRVALPDGGEGWLDSTGLIPLGAYEPTPNAGALRFAQSVRAFSNATMLRNGVSNSGASVHGAVQQAAAVNGLVLPRSMADQMALAPELTDYMNPNDTINYARLQPGDLLFFSDRPVAPQEASPSDAEGDDEEGPEAPAETPTSMGVWLDYGIVLVENPRSFTLRELELDRVLSTRRLIGIRRPFVNP